MDILRKELSEIYEAQRLENEWLDRRLTDRCRRLAEDFVAVSDGCAVITDASCDRCFLYVGSLGVLLGIADLVPVAKEIDSSDEDVIYNRMHPEDLADKRMLEYEFFKFVNAMDADAKRHYRATCRIRILNSAQGYTLIDNTTQVICPSPSGKIWLIMCTYSLASDRKWGGDIRAAIVNSRSGEVSILSLDERRKRILTAREKEILVLIKEGNASKQIADKLNISVHTVNRHRQNIIEKLSVANSVEAVTAAESMGLI